MAGLIEYGAEKYKGILSSKMMGIYGKLFSYLANGGDKNTPDYMILLHSLWSEEAIELLDMWFNMHFESALPRYVKEYIEWYAFQNPKVSMENLSKIKAVIGKLDSIDKWLWTENMMDLFHEVENDIEEHRSSNGMLWFSTGIATIDENCEGLQRGTVTSLIAYAGTGKSKLSYFICNKLLKQGKKVLYFTLEVNAKTVLKNLLANYYDTDYKPLAKWQVLIDFSDYYDLCRDNLEIVDKTRMLDDLVSYAKLKQPDIIIIDFVQNITCQGDSEYDRMSKVAVQIQLLAIETNAAILDLSQISNEWTSYKVWGVIPSKWSGAFVASSDVCIMLYRRDGLLRLTLAKNKFGPSNIETTLIENLSKWTFIDKWPDQF